jgi:signal transduction histidine kinase
LRARGARSLAARLFLTSAAISVILLVAAAFLLSNLFQAAVERNFDARLRAVLDSLLANVEFAADGSPGMQGQLADARFALPLSGWYWQVTPPKGRELRDLASGSLLEQRLVPAESDLLDRSGEGIASFYMTDSSGVQLRVIEQRFKLFGGDDEFSFLVAGNFDELKDEIGAFRRALVIVLVLLGVGLLASIFAQVRFGLRPMREIQESLAAIREGRSEKLQGEFPAEIRPIAEELNLLIESNAEIIDRARTQVGNLAHALKTPLSVLTNEATSEKGAFAAKVAEQTRIMGNQIGLYLDRARRAAKAHGLGAVTDVEPVIKALARTLERIHRDKGTTVRVKVTPGLKFRGEKQDLEELAGNLMDNACKWAKQRVRVTAAPMTGPSADGRNWLILTVADDGPGLPPERRAEALKRGHRLDESKPGSGLGLSIVTETAAMYRGSVDLAESKWGGLAAQVKLPST